MLINDVFNFVQEIKRIEKEQQQWSNAQNVDIGTGDWTLIDCRSNDVITKDDLKVWPQLEY